MRIGVIFMDAGKIILQKSVNHMDDVFELIYGSFNKATQLRYTDEEFVAVSDSGVNIIAAPLNYTQQRKRMKKMAFISRHQPTEDQIRLAKAQGFELVHIGDMDAFRIIPEIVHLHGSFDAVAVVHPAAALNLVPYFDVGIFKNANRAAEGEKPQFKAVSLKVWESMRY